MRGPIESRPGRGLDAEDAEGEGPDETALIFGEGNPDADLPLMDGENTLRMRVPRRGA